MMKMVLPFAWQFGMSFIVFACACSTTNSKPFSTWFHFNNFVDEKFCGIGFTFLLHVSDWKAGDPMAQLVWRWSCQR